jgi:hypothetical protein
MVSPLETAVRQWRELGLLQNRHLGEGGTRDTKGTITDNKSPSKTKRRKKTDKDWGYNKGKRLQQTTLLGANQEKADVEEFGDKLQSKEENTFRVVAQNVQTLSPEARTERSRRLVNTIGKTEAAVLATSRTTKQVVRTSYWKVQSTSCTLRMQ